MAKSQTKSNKLLLVILAVVLIAVAGVLIYFITRPKPQEAQSVMTMSVNPSVQFVLDQNNKVMRVNAMNDDGQALIAQVDFVGKDADSAAKLFVQISTEADYIHVNTTGTNVEINISCDDETAQKYAELKESIKNSVNNYFKEIGVKAGAIVNVGADILEDAKNLGMDVADLAGKTFDEVLDVLETRSEELKDITLSYRDTFYTRFKALQTEFENLFDVEDQIADYKQKLNDSNLPKDVKDSLNKTLDSLEKTYKELKAQYDAKLDEIINELKQLSEQATQTIKTAIETRIQSGKALLDEQIKAFNQNKAEILAEIEAYQNSLA